VQPAFGADPARVRASERSREWRESWESIAAWCGKRLRTRYRRRGRPPTRRAPNLLRAANVLRWLVIIPRIRIVEFHGKNASNCLNLPCI
jgi:hypothetical protein